jgi:hypothetical protein
VLETCRDLAPGQLRMRFERGWVSFKSASGVALLKHHAGPSLDDDMTAAAPKAKGKRKASAGSKARKKGKTSTSAGRSAASAVDLTGSAGSTAVAAPATAAGPMPPVARRAGTMLVEDNVRTRCPSLRIKCLTLLTACQFNSDRR